MKQQIIWMFTFLSMLLFSNGGFAQADTGATTSVKVELKQQLARFKTFSARFQQTVTDLQGNLIQKSEGHLLLKQPEKLRWEVSAPDETTVLADGESLWHIDPFVEQVTVVNQQDAVQSNPIVLLTQQSDEYWNQFSVTKSGEHFVIIPKERSGQITSLTLEFHQNQLWSLTIVDKQQQTSVISFQEVKYNREIANGEFVFQLPQGFDLDDQR